MKVCLVWATKKRHIAVNEKILCQSNFVGAGYSNKNGHYNSLNLAGLPDYEKSANDSKYTHTDGIIEFKPLDSQKTVIIKKSICAKCLKSYHQLDMRTTRHQRASSDQDLLLGDLEYIELYLKVLKVVLKSEYDNFTVTHLELFKADLMKADPIFGGSLKKQEQVIETYF